MRLVGATPRPPGAALVAGDRGRRNAPGFVPLAHACRCRPRPRAGGLHLRPVACLPAPVLLPTEPPRSTTGSGTAADLRRTLENPAVAPVLAPGAIRLVACRLARAFIAEYERAKVGSARVADAKRGRRAARRGWPPASNADRACVVGRAASAAPAAAQGSSMQHRSGQSGIAALSSAPKWLRRPISQHPLVGAGRLGRSSNGRQPIGRPHQGIDRGRW